MDFKDRLRDLRLSRGLTLQQVADYVGLQKAAIYKYEHGLTVNPKRSLIEKLATLFQVSPSYLLGINDEEEKSDSAIKGVRIPVLGNVAAGIPITAITDVDDWEEIPEKMANNGNYFALRIKGQSMEPRIKDGDVVIVKQQEDVDSGDVAIVLVNGDEATVKEIKKLDTGIMLIGWNTAVYSPRFYSAKDIKSLPVRIIGKVVELRGKF